MEQMMMRIQRLLAVMASVLVLSACAIGKPTPQATTYGLEPPPPALAAARRSQILRMGKVRVAPAFADRRLAHGTFDGTSDHAIGRWRSIRSTLGRSATLAATSLPLALRRRLSGSRLAGLLGR